MNTQLLLVDQQSSCTHSHLHIVTFAILGIKQPRPLHRTITVKRVARTPVDEIIKYMEITV